MRFFSVNVPSLALSAVADLGPCALIITPGTTNLVPVSTTFPEIFALAASATRAVKTIAITITAIFHPVLKRLPFVHKQKKTPKTSQHIAYGGSVKSL